MGREKGIHRGLWCLKSHANYKHIPRVVSRLVDRTLLQSQGSRTLHSNLKFKEISTATALDLLHREQRESIWLLGEGSWACRLSGLHISGWMLLQTSQLVQKGTLPSHRPWLRQFLDTGRREGPYSTHPAKVSLCPAEKKRKGILEGARGYKWF